jgi:D-alanyl-D-alanine carboxypeptidase/D-alanyl-D-alanine-endopeptidase (penicillin-binding protein 4)
MQLSPRPIRSTPDPTKFYLLLSALFILSSCGVSKKIEKEARTKLLNDPAFVNAHTGISIFDPSSGKYLYNYQGDKYFVPASNTKIISLYAGLKNLGDSIPGLRYRPTADTIYLQPTGDPGFLHPDYKSQPVFDFLRATNKPLVIDASNFKTEAYGAGWSWDDYNDDYMVERSPLPVYGNLVKWTQVKDTSKSNPVAGNEDNAFIYSDPEVNWKVNFSNDTANHSFSVKRAFNGNEYTIRQGNETSRSIEVPFVTNGIQTAIELLPDTIHKPIFVASSGKAFDRKNAVLIRSRPADTLFKTMMGRSDNFFAEQTLLMVSNEKWGVMDEHRLIDDLLKTDLKSFPQKPNWVDGSGLSHYNLFSPDDFVWILEKMQKEFGMKKIKSIFATGGTGTLRNYYKKDSGYIYAKTGTLAGVIALSGYLITNKNKMLIFSVLVNNHQGSTTPVRRKVEEFIEFVRAHY